jgi:hypothetical protein
MRAEFRQLRRESGDESQRRLLHRLLESRLVPGKPLAVVVPLQLPQEYENFRSEILGFGHLPYLV